MAAFGRRRRGDTEAHWLYSQEFLENGTPSRSHGISFEEECVLRELGCSVIDQLARGMYGKYVSVTDEFSAVSPVRQLAIFCSIKARQPATIAMIYFQRFFCEMSMKDHDYRVRYSDA